MQARLCDIILNDNKLYYTKQLLIFISLTKTKEMCVDCTNDLLLTNYHGEYFVLRYKEVSKPVYFKNFNSSLLLNVLSVLI